VTALSSRSALACKPCTPERQRGTRIARFVSRTVHGYGFRSYVPMGDGVTIHRPSGREMRRKTPDGGAGSRA
jgi:hypothetical protein